MLSASGSLCGMVLPPLRHRGLGAELALACDAAALHRALAAVRVPSASEAPRTNTVVTGGGTEMQRVLTGGVQVGLAASGVGVSIAPAAASAKRCRGGCGVGRHADADCGASAGAAAAGVEAAGAAAAGAEGAQRAVVRITLNPGHWASGVVVDAAAGLVLTNAHVVADRARGDQGAGVTVTWVDPVSHEHAEWQASVLWASAACPAMDAAVLQICVRTDDSGARRGGRTLQGVGALSVAIPPAHHSPGELGQQSLLRLGAPAMAVGYSLLGPALKVSAPVSHGCVTSIRGAPAGNDGVAQASSALIRGSDAAAPWQGPHGKEPEGLARAADREAPRAAPAMVITDAAVHSGCSGGGLFAVQACGTVASPCLLALITSNARHASGVAIPSIGWCLPVDQLQGVLRACAVCASRTHASFSERAACFAGLDQPSPALDALWGPSAKQAAGVSATVQPQAFAHKPRCKL